MNKILWIDNVIEFKWAQFRRTNGSRLYHTTVPSRIRLSYAVRKLVAAGQVEVVPLSCGWYVRVNEMEDV